MTKPARKNTPRRGDESNPRPWEQQFLELCFADQTANSAWRRLHEAGLGNACKRVLREYATGDTSFAEVQRGVALLVSKLEVFHRAVRTEQKREKDPRAQLFRERRETAARHLAKTPWPFRNPRILTFAEANRSYSDLNLFDLRKVRALVDRSRLAYVLVVLRAGASAHGVSLSGNELAALAYCASGDELDGGAVRRLLRESWVAVAEPHCQAVFEDYLASTR